MQLWPIGRPCKLILRLNELIYSSLEKQGILSQCVDTNYEVYDANMAEAVQVMQNIKMNNASANLVTPGCALREQPKKQSQKGSATELIDSDGSGHCSTSDKLKKLHKKKWVKMISSSSLSSESDS